MYTIVGGGGGGRLATVCYMVGGWWLSPYIYHWHAIKQSKGIIDRTSTMEGMFVTNSCNELY